MGRSSSSVAISATGGSFPAFPSAFIVSLKRDRGTRFSHTPYYTTAPPPPNPVPPVPQSTLPASFEPPDLVKRFVTATTDSPIWKSIQFMDHEGMDLLRRPAEDGAKEKWEAYLDRTKVSSTRTCLGRR